MATKPTLADAMRALRVQDPPSPTAHPDFETLNAYHESRLPRDEADAMEEHFIQCRDCTERSLELARFLALPEKLAPQRTLGVVHWLREPSHLQRLAAGLLLATILSSGAWLSSRLQIRRLEDGEVNVPIVEIESGFRRQVAGGSGQELPKVPPGAVLILTPASEPANAGHEIQILDAEGRVVWSGHGLHPTPVGSFHLRLPRGLRPDAIYRIRLLAPRQKSTDKEKEEVEIRITAPGPA